VQTLLSFPNNQSHSFSLKSNFSEFFWQRTSRNLGNSDRSQAQKKPSSFVEGVQVHLGLPSDVGLNLFIMSTWLIFRSEYQSMFVLLWNWNVAENSIETHI